MTNLDIIAQKFADVCIKHKLVLTTAESCTAGLIAATVARISGSSAWLEGGSVVYTPEAKHRLLGVKFETIEKYNITSVEVAGEMAIGAFKKGVANLAIAVTGVAGPNGGTDEIPVGTVAIAWAWSKGNEIFLTKELVKFSGDRNEIREAVVAYSLNRVEQLMEDGDER